MRRVRRRHLFTEPAPILLTPGDSALPIRAALRKLARFYSQNFPDRRGDREKRIPLARAWKSVEPRGAPLSLSQKAQG